jgi:hypothetical protein
MCEAFSSSVFALLQDIRISVLRGYDTALMRLASIAPLLYFPRQPNYHCHSLVAILTNFLLLANRWSRSVDFGKLINHNVRVESLRSSLKWINVQAVLLDICIAFHPLDLPPYVMLEIVDKFPLWSTHVNHKKKIDYIIQVKRFCDALIDARVES